MPGAREDNFELAGRSYRSRLLVGTGKYADFEQTLTLLAEVEYDTVYSFTYSARPGTASCDFGDPVPAAVKLSRLQRLQAFQ